MYFPFSISFFFVFYLISASLSRVWTSLKTLQSIEVKNQSVLELINRSTCPQEHHEEISSAKAFKEKNLATAQRTMESLLGE